MILSLITDTSINLFKNVVVKRPLFGDSATIDKHPGTQQQATRILAISQTQYSVNPQIN